MKPSPPPPPPSPPRRHPSGVGPRGAGAAAALEARYDAEQEIPTAAGHQPDPSTLDRGRAPESVQVDPNARRTRANDIDVSFDDETQARAVDDRLLHKLRAEAAKADADLGIDYESLPSLEVRRPYDTYEKGFPERDPVTQARDSARVRRSDDDSYREPSYQERSSDAPSYREPEPSYRERESYEAQAPSFPAPSTVQDDPGEPEYWGRREESGPRERPLPPSPASYAAPVPSYDDASDSAQWGRDRAQPTGWSSMPPHANDSYSSSPSAPEPMIPPAPRVPDEMRPAFVVGVQPIRTATPDAWGTPRAMTPAPGQYLPSPAQAIHSSMPARDERVYNQAHQAQQHYSQQPEPSYYSQQAQHYGQQVAQAHAHAHQQYAQPAHYSQPAGARMTPYPVAYTQPGQHPSAPAPMHQSGMAPPMMQRAQPVGGQLTQAPASPKVGRFASFVAGAAFGVTFAFFATGFFNAAKTAKEEVPSAPAIMAPAAPTALVAPAAPTAPTALVAPAAPLAPLSVAPTAPAAPALQAAAPAAQPGALAPAVAAPLAPAAAVAPPAVSPGALPAAPPGAAPVAALAPKAAVVPSAPPPPPARPAPPPRAPRAQAPRRPAPPPPAGPKNLGGGGPGADDGPAAPAAPSAPGGDLGDLLGAGLKP